MVDSKRGRGVLGTYWDQFCDMVDIFMDLRDFYFILAAFMIFQYAAYLLAFYAGQHSK